MHRALFCVFLSFLSFLLANRLLKNMKLHEHYAGMQTPTFFNELQKQNYAVDLENKTITLPNGKILSFKKHFNTPESCALAKNKIETSTLLQKNGIPIPAFINIGMGGKGIISSMNDANITFPIVLKPIYGTFGKDVMTDIETPEECEKALATLSEKYGGDVMLEEQVRGDCYRIFVFYGKVIDIIQRKKPYIIGNGILTVHNLIDARNAEQVKMGLHETKNVSTLVLKKQGVNMDTILEKNRKIIISNVINMHNGARIERIPLETIPPENMALFIKVNHIMGLMCSGLDYMSNDITKVGEGVILEVNGTPDTEIHEKIGDGFPFFERVVENLK